MSVEAIFERFDSVPGDIGVYYKNLVTGETVSRRGGELFEAASVIKLPIYAVAEKMAAEGRISLDEKITCREEDKMPSCGALNSFTGEVTADIRTMCALMITLSDNTATNLLIRRLGLDFLNDEFKTIGLEKTHLERLLFDAEGSARGLENRICPEELGALLEAIYRRGFVSEAVSAEMEALLLRQQINHKIPGYLPESIPVAHKTGEDDGITNDVGIVYASEPFVLCFASNRTDVPEAERAIREVSLALTRL